jgi:hypothetical protein
VGIQNLDRNDNISLLTNSIFDDVIKAFVGAFRRVNPKAPPKSIFYAIYFLHGSLIHILSQGRRFERLISEEYELQDPSEILDELAELFANGLDSRSRCS